MRWDISISQVVTEMAQHPLPASLHSPQAHCTTFPAGQGTARATLPAPVPPSLCPVPHPPSCRTPGVAPSPSRCHPRRDALPSAARGAVGAGTAAHCVRAP